MLYQTMLPTLVYFGLLALGLTAGLSLFMTLKYKIRVRARKDRARLDAMLKRLQEADRQIEHEEDNEREIDAADQRRSRAPGVLLERDRHATSSRERKV